MTRTRGGRWPRCPGTTSTGGSARTSAGRARSTGRRSSGTGGRWSGRWWTPSPNGRAWICGADARLLGELLMLPGPSPVLHRMITAHGLPAATWSRAAALLAAGESRERVLLRLWSRSGGVPTAAAG
ncbi:hypothetical protein [Streptomyces sp. NBC_01363]|uniref:hypothetical protein n=1 Tax=Streptomyces sp. NBC_01363 TaxID=2903840 RepID=UPI002253A8D9|nr:hypothetical protein [Streptomyces sp. NBC_01363]MCX4731739.1 hypothetical protein [Streptomyces sp. NBC_01363]